MTGPKGNNEFCFPETLNVSRGEAEGKQNSLFLAEAVIKCFAIPSFSKLEKSCEKIVCFTPTGYKVTAVLRSTTGSRAIRKFMLSFP